MSEAHRVDGIVTGVTRETAKEKLSPHIGRVLDIIFNMGITDFKIKTEIKTLTNKETDNIIATEIVMKLIEIERKVKKWCILHLHW